jgi:hypothetical protein
MRDKLTTHLVTLVITTNVDIKHPAIRDGHLGISVHVMNVDFSSMYPTFPLIHVQCASSSEGEAGSYTEARELNHGN